MTTTVRRLREGTGLSQTEAAETLGVALLMDGGPASVYGPRAWQAFHECADGDTAVIRAAG